MSNEWTSRASICSLLIWPVKHPLRSSPASEMITFRTSGGHQPVAPHFLYLYGLDSTRQPPETEACHLTSLERQTDGTQRTSACPNPVQPGPNASLDGTQRTSDCPNPAHPGPGCPRRFLPVRVQPLGKLDHRQSRLEDELCRVIHAGDWSLLIRLGDHPLGAKPPPGSGSAFPDLAVDRGRDLDPSRWAGVPDRRRDSGEGHFPLDGSAGKPAQALHVALLALLHRSRVRHHSPRRSWPLRLVSGSRAGLAGRASAGMFNPRELAGLARRSRPREMSRPGWRGRPRRRFATSRPLAWKQPSRG